MPHVQSRGFQKVGFKGKEIKEDHLWRTWLEGKSMPHIIAYSENNTKIWSYLKIRGKALVQDWNDERQRADMTLLAANIQVLNKVKTEIDVLRSETKRDAIANA